MSVREVVDGILRDCRVPEERQRMYHERLARAVWRDRAEVMDVIEGKKSPEVLTEDYGVDGRVARFVRSQAAGKTVAL